MTQRCGFARDLRGESPGTGEIQSTFDRLLREYVAISLSASVGQKAKEARLLLAGEVIGAVSTLPSRARETRNTANRTGIAGAPYGTAGIVVGRTQTHWRLGPAAGAGTEAEYGTAKAIPATEA